MSRRFQFSLRALLVLILALACFFGGIRFERERRRREDARISGDDWGCLVPSGIEVKADKPVPRD
jgi:hypothetical protein